MISLDAGDDSLHDPLPERPWELLERWLEEAKERSGQKNPGALVVATADADGLPDARFVLLRGLDTDAGHLVFFTNRKSAKGRQLEGRPLAAALLHWDALGRQARFRGPVVPSPDAESDAYFARRPRASQIAAWASQQSEPLESRARLLEQMEEQAARFGGLDGDEPVPRPPHWGGYRLQADEVELWVSAEARTHDRARWTRARPGDPTSPWTVGRLQP